MENILKSDNFNRPSDIWSADDSEFSFDSYSEEDENVSKSSSILDSGSMYNLCGTETTEHIINKFDLFYKEMMTKINTLKNTKVLKNKNLLPPISSTSSKLFKDLKNTPKVQENIKQIQQLDEDIKDIIAAYKEERDRRLTTQEEMLNEISKGAPVSHEDSSIFIELCEFERSEEQNDNDAEGKDEQTEEENNKLTEIQHANFIKRNIEVARAGSMAVFSLTDEQKMRIEQLLKDNEDNLEVIYEEPEDIDGFSLSETDRIRMQLIDNSLDKNKMEKSQKNMSKKYDLNNEFMLKQALKNIDERIMKLDKNNNTIMESSLEKYRANDRESENIRVNSESTAKYKPETDCLRHVRQNIREFEQTDSEEYLESSISSSGDEYLF